MPTTDVVSPLDPQQREGRAAATHQALRLRETEQVPYAMGFPMLLPVGSPRFLVYADATMKQLVRFDMAAAAGAAGGGQEGTPAHAESPDPHVAGGGGAEVPSGETASGANPAPKLLSRPPYENGGANGSQYEAH